MRQGIRFGPWGFSSGPRGASERKTASQTNAQGARYSAASQNSNAIQVTKDATAQNTLWGIDSDANHNHRISTSELASVSADPAVAGLPDVYGRYVGQPIVNGQATLYAEKDINSAELSAATTTTPQCASPSLPSTTLRMT